ncbi:MAG: hypothetical protein A2Y86_04155 [Candidatus Aminicenantes bacterium RBG_13_62_12]|nr:MAG: hypothetical protein A2Y86_04155 [Candidatus Aminicenantes bacterium RBG_13_62_12]
MSLAVFSLFLLISSFRQAIAAEISLTKPEFNERGEVVIIRLAGDSRFLLQILDPSSGKVESRHIALGPGAGPPKLKKDGRGRLWAAWTEDNGHKKQVILEAIDENLQPRLRFQARLQPSLPWDCAFDSNGGAWLVWVEDDARSQAVRVENGVSGSSWTISSASEEASSPRLLCDARGILWAFWTAVTPAREQVFSSTFDEKAWSDELLMTPGSRTPNITPRASAGGDGRIWLVWSGFDGQDYEILARTWDGRKWSPAVALTRNDGANDVFPSADLAFGVLPVVSWVRYEAQGREEWIRCWQPEGWLGESQLPSAAGQQPFVPLALQGDRAALVRPEGASLRSEWFFLPLPGGRSNDEDRLPSFEVAPRQRGAASLPDLIYNPDLKENVYIAFGDSITSGVCDENGIDEPTDYVPEKAYPIRLEALLSQSYGEHKVINEGAPGESTIQGLARLDPLLAEHKARYILILEGTNDIIWSDYSLDTTVFNLREMLRRNLEYGLLPALATCIPKYGRNAFPVRLTNLNARIRLLAGERPVPLVDLNQDFAAYPAEDGGPESLYCWGEDRTHPNEKGSQFMAEKWFERIKEFPFPPGNFRARRTADEILFYRVEGNLLEWADNSKIHSPENIQEYRIYRKKSAESSSAFTLLTAVSGKFSFFDTNIQPGVGYTYVISTVMLDDLEGPCTQPLSL